MILGCFLRGLLIGLVFGVPAGAIGALTIQRTLEKGFFAGLVTGAGLSGHDLARCEINPKSFGIVPAICPKTAWLL